MAQHTYLFGSSETAEIFATDAEEAMAEFDHAGSTWQQGSTVIVNFTNMVIDEDGSSLGDYLILIADGIEAAAEVTVKDEIKPSRFIEMTIDGFAAFTI